MSEIYNIRDNQAAINNMPPYGVTGFMVLSPVIEK
jgi:hypothetical protein